MPFKARRTRYIRTEVQRFRYWGPRPAKAVPQYEKATPPGEMRGFHILRAQKGTAPSERCCYTMTQSKNDNKKRTN